MTRKHWSFSIESLSNGAIIVSYGEGGDFYPSSATKIIRAGFATHQEAEVFSIDRFTEFLAKPEEALSTS